MTPGTSYVPPPAFGRFRLLHQIGAGVLGPVFRTHDPEGDRLVAVKVFAIDLTPEQAAELATVLDRLRLIEVQAASVTGVIAAGVEDSVAYLAQQYVPGESLDAAVRQYGPAPPADAVRLISHVAAGLDAAAATGLFHGALHPRDILVTPGETHVTGFGVAAALEAVGHRAPIRRPYAAPERESGGEWGAPADVHALAAISYEVLTARRALPGTEHPLPGLADIKAIDAAALHEAILVALDPDPDRRPPTASAFAALFASALIGTAKAGAPGARPARSRRSRGKAARLPGLEDPLPAAILGEAASGLDDSLPTASAAETTPVLEIEQSRSMLEPPLDVRPVPGAGDRGSGIGSDVGHTTALEGEGSLEVAGSIPPEVPTPAIVEAVPALPDTAEREVDEPTPPLPDETAPDVAAPAGETEAGVAETAPVLSGEAALEVAEAGPVPADEAALEVAEAGPVLSGEAALGVAEAGPVLPDETAPDVAAPAGETEAGVAETAPVLPGEAALEVAEAGPVLADETPLEAAEAGPVLPAEAAPQVVGIVAPLPGEAALDVAEAGPVLPDDAELSVGEAAATPLDEAEPDFVGALAGEAGPELVEAVAASPAEPAPASVEVSLERGASFEVPDTAVLGEARGEYDGSQTELSRGERDDEVTAFDDGAARPAPGEGPEAVVDLPGLTLAHEPAVAWQPGVTPDIDALSKLLEGEPVSGSIEPDEETEPTAAPSGETPAATFSPESDMGAAIESWPRVERAAGSATDAEVAPIGDEQLEFELAGVSGPAEAAETSADDFSGAELTRGASREDETIDDFRAPGSLVSEPPVPKALDPGVGDRRGGRALIPAWAANERLRGAAIAVGIGFVLVVLALVAYWSGAFGAFTKDAGEPRPVAALQSGVDQTAAVPGPGQGEAAGAPAVPATGPPATITAVPDAPQSSGASPAAVSEPAAPPTPSAPAAPVRSGEIRVTSTPTRADVFVNGDRRGVTPRNLRELPLGTYTIRVTRPGYSPQEQVVTLSPDRTSARVAFTLPRLRRSASPSPSRPAPAPATRPAPKATPPATAGSPPKPVVPAPGSISFETRPGGVRVLLDGREVGRSPLVVPNVKPGRHDVRLELPGYRPWVTTVTLAPGQRLRVTASLERAPSR